MKKFFIGKLFGLVILVVLVSVFYFAYSQFLQEQYKSNIQDKSTFPRETSEISVIPVHLCYEYHQLATTLAPYKVDEHIDIVVLGKTFSGNKTGTQSGPDMTNGYQGSLSGTIDNNIFTGLFSYTVEGSKNIEQEEYHIDPSGLIKYRYVLVEKNGVLVPDKTTNPKQMIYRKVSCE